MKKRVQRLAAGLLSALMVFGTCANGTLPVLAQEAGVGAADLSDNETQAPDAWGALPSPNQYRYQKDELAAFCHFGPNTFEGVEWGENYGNRAPSDIFRLKNDFDADTIVKAMQDAGFQKLIITAKHHDGFCLWNSAYTDYDVAAAGYKGGEGDILAEISAACTKYDMDMGLYLSPWDIHEPSYGYYDAQGNATTKENDALDYNAYYNNQLEEILGNDKYGNDGHFVEVWMDGAKGSGANAQDYEFQTWFDTIQKNEGKEAGYDDDCMLFGAEAYTTVRWIGNELGLANEETWAKSQVNYENNTIESDRNGTNRTTIGIPDGNQWTVPEADSRITSGWFWGTNKKTPKSLQDLSEMYFNSVGHNAVLLLNIPPNTEGTVDQAILDRMKEFGDNIKRSFAKNLAENAVVTASSVRGNSTAFSPENVIDGDDATYWTMDDDSTTGSLTLDLGGVKRFDLVTIEEAIQLGQRIKSFTVEYKLGDGAWQAFSQGTTIGAKRICREKAVTADKIRITITGSYAVPLISEVGVYKATEGFAIASPIPDGLEKILISDTDISDGSGFVFSNGWTNETGTQFIDGVSTYAGSGKTATLTFNGHKVWLFGTKDPNHGTADVYVDGEKIDSFDTNASVRATGQMIYESPDFEAGEHTLEVRTTGTIGLNAAAVLNNEERGVLQFEKQALTMEEDSVEEVVVKRVGGSKGSVSVYYENNPGSAVQGNYDVDGLQGELVFADGEMEKVIRVTTKRDVGVKGELDFTVDLIGTTGGALLGFCTSLGVVIRDMDDPGRLDEAKELLADVGELNLETYMTEGQAEVQRLTAQLSAYLKAEDMIAVEDIVKMAAQLQAAREKLKAREVYTEDDPFVFPVSAEVKTLEAELFTLDASNAVNANNYVRIQAKANASNGKEVDWFEEGNRILLPFTAAKAGTYTVTATYRSGRPQNNPNAFEWGGTNISSGSRDVYGDANQYQTVSFEVTIDHPGTGEWIFTAGEKCGPVIDKFTIASQDQTAAPVAVTGVTLDQTELTLTDAKKQSLLSAVVLPEDATNKAVTFASANPQIAEVTEDGLVIGHQNGSTEITVTTEDGSKTAVCRVTVERGDFAAAALADALSEADRILKAGQGIYTNESWSLFQNKYNLAVAGKDGTDFHALKALTDALSDAMSGLEVKEPNPSNDRPNSLREPTDVTVVSRIDGVRISFASVPGAVSYDIYRSVEGEETQKIARVETNVYVDKNAPGGVSLDYWVVAIAEHVVSNSSGSKPASVTLPKAVSGLKVKAESGGVTISFKQVKGAKKYIILRATEKYGVYKKIKTLKAKQTSFVDKKAKKGKNYYKVVAQKGNTYSPAGKVKRVTVKKSVKK